VSGPVTQADAPTVGERQPATTEPTLEITASHEAQVGALTVRRALPRRARRTVGAWCFVDHMGPISVTEERGADIGPHPHMGLQTVTWLVAGELLHRDSLGSEQLIQPGQLNLMTAGAGVAHAEESTGRYTGDMHGVQLWVAQPSATRDGDPAFEHHAELPKVSLERGEATVLVGTLESAESPARRDTNHLGVDLVLWPGTTTVPLQPTFEHALVVIAGAVMTDGERIEPGNLAYLGCGRDELALTVEAATRVLLIGGVPFEEPVLMWWNFVARTRDEVTLAYEQWQAGGERFGTVRSDLPRIPANPPIWLTRS
jgi:redox-sensitive bicupin YhaK (pirin superfamily)